MANSEGGLGCVTVNALRKKPYAGKDFCTEKWGPVASGRFCRNFVHSIHFVSDKNIRILMFTANWKLIEILTERFNSYSIFAER